MSTDWRALCEELADGLASTGEAASGTYSAPLECQRIRREILAIAAKLVFTTDNIHD